MDRIAGVAGAWSRKPEFCSLVIDIGTAITYDLIDEKGRYHGGGISPGLALRCRALHSFTARLPLVDHNIALSSLPLVGHDTVSSIRSGVLHGTAAEIDGMIARYKAENPGCLVWLTGGDAALFAGCLKSQIFAAPNLVLEGLNSILNCNVANPS
jgi:type III pantothenate kinase